MDIGATIKHFRTQEKMKQKDLAERLNVSDGAISSWERNRTEPSLEMIMAMCAVFNCKKTEFFAEDQDMVLSAHEAAFISDYRSLSDADKHLINRVMSLLKNAADNL